MSEMVSPYNNFNISKRYAVMPSYNPEGEEYLYNTIKNLQERVKLLEENVDKLIKKYVGTPQEPSKSFEESISDLEEFYKKYGTRCSIEGAIEGYKAKPYSTIYGTHTFLDCASPVQDSKRTVDFYNK